MLRDIKDIRVDIKAMSSKDLTESILSSLGVYMRGGKVMLREEKTPSSIINKDGSVYDFGSGILYPDIVSVLYDGLGAFDTLYNATIWVAQNIGIEIEIEDVIDWGEK